MYDNRKYKSLRDFKILGAIVSVATAVYLIIKLLKNSIL